MVLKIKENLFYVIYGFLLLLFTVYLLLDTFLIERVYEILEDNDEIIYDTGDIISDDDYYKDSNIEISINTYREYDTYIYVADIQLNDAKLLKSAFANNTFGQNITQKTSVIAEDKGAILAINGDYYGVQKSGYVLKNGVVYRVSARDSNEDLVIYDDGSFGTIVEGLDDIYDVLDDGGYNILSFGPVLIRDSIIDVSTTEEVDKAKSSNPRTAIGIVSDLHYVFVVSDGRTSDSEGLSLYELAEFMESLGVSLAYNLDGGGSSVMYFNGNIINNPTSNGKMIKERSVSDIVYIGY